ncbi:MAG TPA: CARDB domain-containing protein, partial [Verrucomicrobiae bacterium]|nr:CARDB domain-containing protein [Verrucomicrobiae bacterium]
MIDSRPVPDSTFPLTIGSAEGGFVFAGALDEIAIFKRALSGNEINTIMAAGVDGGCPSSTYDPTLSFSTQNGNPNGVWSYGWMPTDFSAYTAYTNHGDINWYGWGGDATPGIWRNYGGPAYGVPSGWLSLHPGNGTEPCVLRWTAPGSGIARVTGRFLAGDGGVMQVAVRRNNQSWWNAVDSGVFALTDAVTTGDVIDFAVYGGYGYGNTPLEAQVTLTPDNLELPDLRVTDVRGPALAQPGESVFVSWTTTNGGRTNISAPFSETVYLTPGGNLGARYQIATFIQTNPLPVGSWISQTQRVTIPAAGIAGSLRFAVETDSDHQVSELAELNNIGLAEAITTIPLRLTLNVAAQSIREDASPPTLFATVTRNGPVSQPLVVDFASSAPTELSAPPTVIIPASQSSVGFNLTVHPDGMVDDNQLVTISATTSAFDTAIALVNVLNVDLPTLQLSLSAETVTEGQTVIATLTRQTADTALDVQITTSSPTHVSTPSILTFAPGAAVTNFLVTTPEDNVIQPLRTFTVTATAPGQRSASANLRVEDNDMPTVELLLSSTNISEGGGPQAATMTVRRSPITARELILEFESTNHTAALVPNRVVIPAGADAASFPIAAVNDEVVDGAQQTLIRAFVIDSGSGARLAEGASVLLTVADDDGPTLKVLIAADLVAEGRNPASTATVSRNTSTNESLTVFLTSSHTNEVTVPESVSIPAGATSVVFTVGSVNDGRADGSQTVTVTANAPGFTSGSDTIVVSDVDLPDLMVASIAVPVGGVTDSSTSITYRLANQGLTPAGSNITTRVFISRDPLVGDDVLAGQYTFAGVIPPGLFFEQTVSLRLPSAGGEYWIVVLCDANSSVREVLEDNNVGVSATPIHVRAAYEATVATPIETAPLGTAIPLTGRALLPGTSTPPPASSLVNVNIYVRGTHRVISALTDAQGYFNAVWQPLPAEAGLYEIGAAHPGEADAPRQDSFTLIGFRASPGETFITLSEESRTTNQITLQNLSPLPLTGLTATILEQPTNLDVELNTPGSIPGGGSATITYTVSSHDASVPRTIVPIRLTVSEGLTNDIFLYVTVEALRPRLIALPDALEAGMKRGAQRFVEFSIANLGGSNTGPLTVLAPNISWLRIASTNPLPALAPGQTNRISLQLLPESSLPLGDYPGALVVSDGSAFVNVPFKFRALSDERGDLLITAVDEYTYYAAGSPNLSNATVLVRDALSGAVVTNGITGPDGTFFVPQVLEGFYEIQVDADKHVGYRDTKLLVAGLTNNIQTFLSRQMVQYRWTVLPTQVEDRTRIEIETTFETVVPAPVITIEPAVIDLSTVLGNEAQVNLRISNHGLIAAENLRLRFDSHPDWELTPLVTEFGDFAANSSLTIPMMIRRKQAGGVFAVADSSSPCVINGAGTWELTCGEKKNYAAPVTAINASSNCGGGTGGTSGGTSAAGNPGGVANAGWAGGRGGGSGSPTAPFVSGPTFSPPTVCDCGLIPSVCLGGSISFELDGMAKKLGEMILSKLPNFRLVKTEVALNLSGQVCICCEDNSLGYNGNVTGSASLKVVVEAGPGVSGNIKFDAGPEWQGISASFNALLGVRVTIGGSVEVQYSRDCDGEEKMCASGEASLAAFAGGQVKASVGATQVSTGASFSGEIDGQIGIEGSLSAKVHGCSDGDMDFTVCGQVIARCHLTGTVKATIAGQEVSETIGPNGDSVLVSLGSCGGRGGVHTLSEPPPEEGTNLVEQVPGRQFLRPAQEVMAALRGDQPQQSGVCAKVRIRLSQEAVLTRDAFQATLELDNESGTTLENIAVDVLILSAAGQNANGLFGLRDPVLSGITGVDGTGLLGNGASGRASWILLPTVDAALSEPAQYFVGGVLHYTQNGTPVTIPLSAAPITVHPLPQLALDYFHQRDVYADDPFTDAVEPSIPYSLAVMARNTGAGTARNFRITSAQPQIVDNNRGLLIDFKIIATEVSGRNLTPSLTADFGDIAPGNITVGRWLFTSTLQGLFTDYKATFENLDILGNPGLAIVTNVTIHEMTRIVWARGPYEDGKPDFLVNEIADPPLDLPDTLYLSDGTKASVAVVTQSTVSGVLSPASLSIQLNATAPGGWVYFRVPDPGNGEYT